MNLDNDNQFWFGVWMLVAITVTIGLFPISACMKDGTVRKYETVQRAIIAGCSLHEGPNGSLNLDCPKDR